MHIYYNEIIEIENIQIMKDSINNLLYDQCKFIKEIYYSDNPSNVDNLTVNNPLIGYRIIISRIMEF